MTTQVSKLDRPSPVPSRFATLWPYAAGAAVGAAALVLGTMEMRWTVYIMGAVLGGLVFLVIPDTRRLMMRAFVISLQADLCVRFMYGKAGSGGLALYMTSIIAIGLAAHLAMTTKRGELIYAGALKKPIAAWFITTLLSLVMTNERFVGITELFFCLQIYLVYWVTLNTIHTEERLEEFVKLLFICLAMQSLVYFFQSATGMTFTLTGKIIAEGDVPRPGGTVSTNPAGFASFIIPILFLAVTRFVTIGAPMTFRSALLVVMGIAALVLTVTRASWGAFVLGAMVLVFLSIRRGVLRPRALPAFAAAAFVLFMAAWPMMATRLQTASVSDSYDERALLMEIALRVIAAHPVFGVGAGAYPHTYKAYVGDVDGWLYTVHNEYLLRTAETGIPGGIAFVALIITSLRQALRVSRATTKSRTLWTLGLGWAAALLGLCFEIYWDAWRGFTYNAMLWMMFALTEVAERLAGTAPERRERIATAQGTGSTEINDGALGTPAAP